MARIGNDEAIEADLTTHMDGEYESLDDSEVDFFASDNDEQLYGKKKPIRLVLSESTRSTTAHSVCSDQDEQEEPVVEKQAAPVDNVVQQDRDDEYYEDYSDSDSDSSSKSSRCSSPEHSSSGSSVSSPPRDEPGVVDEADEDGQLYESPRRERLSEPPTPCQSTHERLKRSRPRSRSRSPQRHSLRERSPPRSVKMHYCMCCSA